MSLMEENPNILFMPPNVSQMDTLLFSVSNLDDIYWNDNIEIFVKY